LELLLPKKKIHHEEIQTLSTDETNVEISKKSENDIKLVSIDEIRPNPNQPRKNFNNEALNELAQSITKDGLLQPILVVPSKENKFFFIVAGERRWRASKIAGMKKIPVLIQKESNPQKMLDLALIENLQREDLNPIEEAEAYKKLNTEFGLSHDAIGTRVGKSRSYISNSLRILSLPAEIDKGLSDGKVTIGQVRPLLSLNSNDALNVYKRILSENYSARDVEKEVKSSKLPKNKKNIFSDTVSLNDAVARMMQKYGRKVIVSGNDKRGKIIFEYYSKEDLINLFEQLLESRKN